MDRILYVHDQNTHQFFFFLEDKAGRAECEAKVTELAEKYGYKTLYGDQIPPFPMETKSFDKFYGTVWLATLQDGDKFRFSIHSHWKSAKVKQGMGYKVKKIVLAVFDESKVPYQIKPAKKRKHAGIDLGPIDLEVEDIEKEIKEAALK